MIYPNTNATLPDQRATDCYGEIYTYEGRFWAEIILEEDGFTTVTTQSPEFDDREAAVSWLAERGLAQPATLLERSKEVLSDLPLPQMTDDALQAWQGLAGSR